MCSDDCVAVSVYPASLVKYSWQLLICGWLLTCSMGTSFVGRAFEVTLFKVLLYSLTDSLVLAMHIWPCNVCKAAHRLLLVS